MGNKSSSPPPNPCPGTKDYAQNLSNSNDEKRSSIPGLTAKVKEKQTQLDTLTATNKAFIKQRDAMYTSIQVDDKKRAAMKPLENTITKNNVDIEILRNDITKLNAEINDLNQKLVDERKITDPILSVSNNAVRDFKMSEINANMDGNDKYYTYYRGIVKQNEKLSDKLKNSDTSDFTYDQKANFQHDQVYAFIEINYVLFITYFVFIIVLIGFLFFVQRNMSIYLKIVIIISLGIYPFVIYTIEEFIYKWVSYITAIISGNVYVKTS
jgi:hypothetical protein